MDSIPKRGAKVRIISTGRDEPAGEPEEILDPETGEMVMRQRIQRVGMAEGVVQGKPEGEDVDDIIADGVTVLVKFADSPMPATRVDVKDIELI